MRVSNKEGEEVDVCACGEEHGVSRGLQCLHLHRLAVPYLHSARSAGGGSRVVGGEERTLVGGEESLLAATSQSMSRLLGG